MTAASTSNHLGRLILATLTNNLMCVGYGCLSGYPSPALPDMNRHPNPFRLDSDEQSWMGSIMALGTAVGALACGAISDFFGRKVAMMTSALLVIITLTVMASSTDERSLYAGGFLYGVFSIINFTSSNMYMSEIAPAHIRGRLTTMNTTFAYALGMLLVYVAGSTIPWNWLAVFVAAIYAIATMALASQPESPRWLLLKGQKQQAIDVFEWFRGSKGSDDVQEEVRVIEEYLAVGNKLGTSSWKALLEAENLKSLAICCTAYLIQAFSGVMVLQIFAVTIFDMAGVNLDANLQSIITGLFFLFGSIVCPLVVDRIGRRSLFMASASVVGVCMTATGCFFLVDELDSDYAHAKLFWLPVVALSLGTFGYAIGLDPVPNLMACEMFPTKVRGNVQTITNCLNGLIFFACLKSFTNIQETINTSGTFFVYACVCTAGIIFSVYVLKDSGTVPMR